MKNEKKAIVGLHLSKGSKSFPPDCCAKYLLISRWQFMQGAQDCSMRLSKASSSRSKSASLCGAKFLSARTL